MEEEEPTYQEQQHSQQQLDDENNVDMSNPHQASQDQLEQQQNEEGEEYNPEQDHQSDQINNSDGFQQQYSNDSSQQQQPSQFNNNRNNSNNISIQIPISSLQQSNMSANSNNSQFMLNQNNSKTLIDGLFSRYSSEVQQQFAEFSVQPQNYEDDQDQQSGPQQNANPCILARDIPLVMRVSFYHDNITFHATPTDKPELFNLPNSYKFIMENYSAFSQLPDIDPNQQQVTYQEFVDFAYYFVMNNPTTVFLRQDVDASKSQRSNESPLQRELMDNIAKYEEILMNPKISQQERAIAQRTIDSLKEQLNALLSANNTSKISKKSLPKNEQRLKNLKEAFAFYSKQQAVTGTKFTFDRIVHEHNVVSLACFLLMLKQHNILNANKHVTKREVIIMFKKYAMNHKEVDFNTFQIMLEKIAIAFYKDEENLSSIDAVEKMYQYLQVDNIGNFRSKMQLLNAPFNIQMKNGFRLLPFDQGREILLKKVDPVVKEKLKLRKEEKSQQMMFSSPQNFMNSKSTPNIISKDNQPSIFAPQHLPSNYLSKKGKASITKIDQQQKISWQQLERLSFTDMKNLNRGLFKPSDLFNDNDDDEDRIYLAEYNLQEDKRKKIEQSISNKRGQENYGQIKETLRPSQVYLLKQDPNYSPSNPSLRYGNQNQNLQRNYQEYYSPQPERSNKQQQALNQKYSERAMQVDKDQRSKERNLMQSIINNSDLKIQRGIQAANRNK